MKIYKKLFKYVQGERIYGYIAIVLSAMSSFLMVYGFYSIYKFLDSLVVYEDLSDAKSFAIKTAIYLTLGAVIYIVSGIFSHLLGFRLETNLRKRGIDGLADASFRFFDVNSSGSIRKTIDDNAGQTHQVVAHMIPDNSQAFLCPILTIILGFIISIRVGIIVVAVCIIGGIIMKNMMNEGEFMKIYQEALQKLSGETVEYIRGMSVVKIFGAKVDSFKALHKAILNYSKYAYEYSLSCRKPYVLFQTLFFGGIAIIIIPTSFIYTGLGDGRRLAVELIMIMLILGVLFASTMRIMWVSMYVFQANYAVDTLENLYNEMKKDQLSFGEKNKFENYDIEFDKVTFGYNDKAVVENLSFKLEGGKSYALVGSSGSGKSTIAKLISGFYKVDSGKIKIGGSSIEEYTQDTLIKNISFVFQNPKLFKKTIYENVALAKEGSSEEEVMNAIHLAGCDEILKKFSTGKDTVIGSKGVYLSGGEKQRIAIARAILKDSRIIIMDEASAAIDPDNEHELQKAFKNLMKGRTVIMIAHRLSSIRAVDEIIVLENGSIVERGSDSELIEENKKYKALVDMYNTANDWRVGYGEVL